MVGTERVLDFVLGLTPGDLPDAAIHQGKRCFLDALGALLAGTDTPAARLMADFARGSFAGNGGTLLVHGDTVSSVGAALANGFAANALDIDDGFRLVKGHPGSCVLPVLIAAAEASPTPVNGNALLATLIIGYEVGIRAGLIRHALYPTYHSSGSWGAIAGAAVAGRLLGLDRDRLREAMGAAEYHAPIAPMMKGIAKPSMGKDSIGWGAMVGMASAIMARDGFTGIAPLFDEAPEPQWIESLGRDYRFLDLYFKPYAACRWAQPAVAGALDIFRDNKLSIDAIDIIRVKTFRAAAALSCKHPENTEEAQYNLAFPVAAALLDGEVGPVQVLPPRIFDADLLSLADKIMVEVDERFEEAFPQKTFTEVVIHTRDGKALASGPLEPLWEPPATLPSDAELEEKFHRLTAPILGEKQSRRLIDLAWHLETVGDAKDIVRACIKRRD